MPCHTPNAYRGSTVIESVQNPRIKALSLLKNRREREREGMYLIEGLREVKRALAGWARVKALLFCPQLLHDDNLLSEMLLQHGAKEGVETLELSQRAFEKLSLRQNPDGIIALATMNAISKTSVTLNPPALPTRILPTIKRDNALILILDSLEKPGNVGALLRTADAVAADAVILMGDGTDMYNPNVIRASMGSLFARPVVTMTREGVLEYCLHNHIKLVISSPHTQQNYWQSNLKGRVALVLGNEARGLDKQWLESEHVQVTIPMLSQDDDGLADSLNVATAGALLLYEVLRQNTRTS